MRKISFSIFIIIFALLIASPVYSVKLIEEEEIITPEIIQEITETPEKAINAEEKTEPVRVNRSSENTNKETDSKTPNKFKVSSWLLVIIVIAIIALLLFRKMISNVIRSEEIAREALDRDKLRKQQKEAEDQRVKEQQAEEAERLKEQEEAAKRRKEQAEEAKRRKEQKEAQLLKEKKHYEQQCKKYGKDVYDRLLSHEVWEGMSEEQLFESKGNADDKSESSRRTIYKFGRNIGPRGGITYELEVIVRDGFVASWTKN